MVTAPIESLFLVSILTLARYATNFRIIPDKNYFNINFILRKFTNVNDLIKRSF
jgi:hypothetical protein